MYTIIVVNDKDQEPVEMGIWVSELTKAGWKIPDQLPYSCWKKFDTADKSAYKTEFLAAVGMADLVPFDYIISYSEDEPNVGKQS